jgi:hypothetical protein
VYSYPRILKLIESAYLAISVLDREGNVVAFAAFEDFPQGLRGMQDDRHYNYWEVFFRRAYKIDDFSSQNTLWLTYFNSGGSISYKEQKFVFKRILQTVYTSLPEIIGILFLASKYSRQSRADHGRVSSNATIKYYLLLQNSSSIAIFTKFEFN